MLQPGAPNAVESARSGTFQQYRGRSSSTVEAAAAAETPAVGRRHRRNPCSNHQCHPPCHHRSRVRHHRRHPRLNDRSLPTPRTGGAHLAPSNHHLHLRFPRPTAAAAVTPVAVIAPAAILTATSGSAERGDVCGRASWPSRPHTATGQRSRPSLAPMCKIIIIIGYCGSFLNKLLSPKWTSGGGRRRRAPPAPARIFSAQISVMCLYICILLTRRAAGSGSRCASYRLLSMDPLSYERK